MKMQQFKFLSLNTAKPFHGVNLAGMGSRFILRILNIWKIKTSECKITFSVWLILWDFPNWYNFLWLVPKQTLVTGKSSDESLYIHMYQQWTLFREIYIMHVHVHVLCNLEKKKIQYRIDKGSKLAWKTKLQLIQHLKTYDSIVMYM